MATALKQELVSLPTIKMSVALVTPESGLALEGTMMTPTRVVPAHQSYAIRLGSIRAVIRRPSLPAAFKCTKKLLILVKKGWGYKSETRKRGL